MTTRLSLFSNKLYSNSFCIVNHFLNLRTLLDNSLKSSQIDYLCYSLANLIVKFYFILPV